MWSGMTRNPIGDESIDFFAFVHLVRFPSSVKITNERLSWLNCLRFDKMDEEFVENKFLSLFLSYQVEIHLGSQAIGKKTDRKQNIAVEPDREFSW